MAVMLAPRSFCNFCSAGHSARAMVDAAPQISTKPILPATRTTFTLRRTILFCNLIRKV